MKVSRRQADENRAKVLEVAGRLFRARGFEGIGVADIMGAAGLTHGGFYGQFDSKEKLAAEACAQALRGSADKWERLCRAHPDSAAAAIIDFYLSPGHVAAPGSSCLLSTLAVDVSRRTGPLRRVFSEGVERLAGILARALPGQSDAARRDTALATLASLVGAVVLARAADSPALADEILAATGRSLDHAAAAAREGRPSP